MNLNKFRKWLGCLAKHPGVLITPIAYQGVILQKCFSRQSTHAPLILKPLIKAVLLAIPLVAVAAPPEPPPVQTQSESGSVSRQGAGAPARIVTPAQTVPGQTPVAPYPPLPKEFPGIPMGSFLLFPEVVLSATYDDNIYAQRTNEVRDLVYTLSPALEVKSNWTQHALNFELGADLDRYDEQRQENIKDFWLGFDGHYDLSATSNIFGGARHSRDHEDRSAPGAPTITQQAKPTLFNHDESHLGFATAFDKLHFRVGGTYDKYDFQDGETTAGATVNNDFRDRKLTSLGGRASYVFAPGSELFAQYATDKRNYDNVITGTTFNRDSDGYRAALGWKFTLPKQALAGEVFGGTMHQNFDYTGFTDISKPYYGAVIGWRPNPLVNVTGFVDRALEETTVYSGSTYASSSIDTTYGFEIERKITSNLSANGRAAYTRSVFQDFDRSDKVIDAGAGVRYYVSSSVFLGADLRVINRNSSDRDAQYSRSQLLFSIGYTPARTKNYSLGASEPVFAEYTGPAEYFAGWYAGAALGFGTIDSKTFGLRDGTGSDTGPMGDSGFSETGFLGYGFVKDRWYLGAEVEAEASQAQWYHKKTKDDSRTAQVDKESGYGYGLRAGYIVDSGALLYARVGHVDTKFHTYYTVNDQTAGAYNRDETLNGTRFGIGADVPAGDNLFVRLDYSYVDYGGYDVNYTSSSGPATERFETKENLFRLGLGWRFDAASRGHAPTREPVRGFYAGAHAGHGSLDSQLDGQHVDSGAGPYPFTGAFGEMGGVYGFFAGYGLNYGRWYGGVELEADENRMRWMHARETGGSGGRDFSVEKKSDYGASLRLGYTLRTGTLLYARAGVVRGRFNTTWAKGGSSSADVDRSDTMGGARYGLGAEVPVWESGFVRFDYTRTDYKPYGFTTTHGSPDQMSFDNRENLFRLGMGFRF